MKKKKIKKIINKLKKKSERELDVEVDVLNDKIMILKNETNDIHNAILTWDKKVNRIDDKLNHVDERTMALDNVKINNWVNHTKQLEDKIKILMDRTTTDYSSEPDVTYHDCFDILRCMASRGASKSEIDTFKRMMNKYIFRAQIMHVSEEVNDG